MCDLGTQQSTDGSDTSIEGEEYEDYGTAVKRVFRPYEEEPLAKASEQSTNDDHADEDGLTAIVLKQRFENVVPVQNWCSCENCHVDRLVLCQEFRCCKEIVSCLGRFTFDGLDASCILKHPDYQAMTNKTVLLQVGPLFTDKEGRRYRKHGNENEFIKAVAYRWLIRWLCGYMGWENTRPLPACIYHDIRCRYNTSTDSKGYQSVQDRASKNS